MKRDCQHGPRDRALKAAFRRLVERCGGVELAAQVARVSAATISNWQGQNTDNFPPIHALLALEEVAGVAEVSKMMAGMVETDPVASTPADMLSGVGHVAGHFGTVAQAISAALVDGHLDAGERMAISGITSKMLEAAQALHKMAAEAV